ncbi:MAG: hypothetical protein AAF799_37600 [Myxococcota bacterium]
MRTSIAIGVLGVGGLAAAGGMLVASVPRPEVAVERAAGPVVAPEDAVRWEARFSPAEDRPRLVATVDREPTAALELDGDDGIALPLTELDPGAHFLELTLARRGGRVTRFTDQVLAGPWQSDVERGCDIGLTLSPEGLHDLLLPVIEEKVLAGARSNEYFGETSYLSRRTLEVVDGGLYFDVFLDTREEGKGDLAVAGFVDVAGQGDDGATVSLRRIDRAVPGPKLEAMAEAEGSRKVGAIGVTVGSGIVAATGGGALIGVAAALGGGYVGSKIGERVGKQTVRREVRREAREQIEGALRQVTQALVLPAGVTVLPTQPELVADLHWCGAPSLTHDGGLQARLRVDLHADALSEEAARMAVSHGTMLPEPRAPSAPEDNLHVDVSGDFINRMLAEWTVRNGLQQALDASGLKQQVQAQLGDRTRWQVQALRVEVPPMVRPVEGGRIDATLAGVVLELLDPERAVTRTVVMGSTGALTLTPLEPLGSLQLGGSLDEVYLGCRERREQVERRVPCFSAVLDPRALRQQLDDILKVRSNQLPVLDLGALFRLQIFGDASPRALELADFRVQAQPDLLVIDARVR